MSILISASVVGIILIPGNLLGNEFLKMKLHLLSPLHVNFNFQQLLERNSIVSLALASFCGYFTFSFFSEERACVQLNVFFMSLSFHNRS
jgi:hypothetical protein